MCQRYIKITRAEGQFRQNFPGDVRKLRYVSFIRLILSNILTISNERRFRFLDWYSGPRLGQHPYKLIDFGVFQLLSASLPLLLSFLFNKMRDLEKSRKENNDGILADTHTHTRAQSSEIFNSPFILCGTDTRAKNTDTDVAIIGAPANLVNYFSSR